VVTIKSMNITAHTNHAVTANSHANRLEIKQKQPTIQSNVVKNILNKILTELKCKR